MSGLRPNFSYKINNKSKDYYISCFKKIYLTWKNIFLLNLHLLDDCLKVKL